MPGARCHCGWYGPIESLSAHMKTCFGLTELMLLGMM